MGLPSFNTQPFAVWARCGQCILTLIVLPTEALTAGPEASTLLLLVALAEPFAKQWHPTGQDLSLRSNVRRWKVNQLRLSLTHLPVNSKVRWPWFGFHFGGSEEDLNIESSGY